MAIYYHTAAVDGTWTNVGNWIESDGTTPAAPPGTGDSVVFDGRSVGALTGSPSGTIGLTKVQVKQSMQYAIGTALAPITAAVTTFIVGEDADDSSNGSGCPLLCWDFGATASGYSGTTARVLKSNTTSSTTGLAVVQLKGTHSSNKLYVEGQSSVGFGVSFPGAAYTVSQVNVTGSNARVTLGSGGTLTTVYQKDGFAVVNCAFTTLNQVGGTLRTEGSGTVTTMNIGGTVEPCSTGTVTTADIGNGGKLDCSKSSVAATFTNCTVHGTGVVDLRNGQKNSKTFSNGIITADGASTQNVFCETDQTITLS